MPPVAEKKKRRKVKSEVMLVRIYPRDPKRGHLAASFTVSGSPYGKLRVERGWYRVKKSFALSLAKYTNNPNDPRSPKVFQICTAQEAVAIKDAEQEAIRLADASNPIPLPKGEDEEWEDEEEEEPEIETVEETEPEEPKSPPKDLSDFDEADFEDEADDLPEPPVADLVPKKKKPRRSVKRAKTTQPKG